jgi:hypothetical protein
MKIWLLFLMMDIIIFSAFWVLVIKNGFHRIQLYFKKR